MIMIFKWSELKKDTADRQANLSQVILRIYKDAATTKEKCSNATLYAKVFYRYSSGGEIKITGKKIDIELSNGRKWEDPDLTPAFKSLWPIPDGDNQVYVTVIMDSKCQDKNLPIKLLDLKSIKKLKLRRRLYTQQPVRKM